VSECIRDDSTECDCEQCVAAEERFWREQGEGGDSFDVSDVDDDTDVEGPCSHVFNGDSCERCGAPYDPIAHGHRILPEDDVSW